MNRKPIRKPLKQIVADNRATISFMSALAGVDAPKFHELSVDIAKPQKATTALKTGKLSTNPTEAQILKSVMAFLRAHPAVAWVMRVNSGTFVESYGGSERYIQANSQKGMSDVCGMMVGGRFFALECKSKTGKVSVDQDAFLLKIIQGGGLAGVCRSIDEAQNILFR